MTPWLVLATIGLIVGAVVAVSARDARTALLGLLVALIAVPIAGSPDAGIAALAGRLVAGVLAVYVLWVAARGRDVEVEASRIGWAAEAAAATAAAILGFAAAGLGGPAGAPPETSAAAFALIATSIRPVVRAADTLSLGIGLLLLAAAACLLWASMGGPLGGLEELAAGALLVAVAGGAGLVTVASRVTSGSLDLAMAGPAPASRPRRGRPSALAGPAVDLTPSWGQAHRVAPPEGVETIGLAEPRAATPHGLAETASILAAAPPPGPTLPPKPELGVEAPAENGRAASESAPAAQDEAGAPGSEPPKPRSRRPRPKGES